RTERWLGVVSEIARGHRQPRKRPWRHRRARPWRPSPWTDARLEAAGAGAMRLVVATPYPEGSTLAVARAAESAGSLDALYVSGFSARIERSLPQRGRSREFHIPSDLVRARGGSAELARGLLGHTPGMEALS